MKSLGYKLYIQFIEPLVKNWKEFISKSFALFGGLYTAVEIELNFIGTAYFLEIIRNNFKVIIVMILIVALILNRQKPEYSEHIGEKDYCVTLKLSNLLFEKNSAVVIPTCTTFDTTMYDGFINKESIQGQFQRKFYNNKLEELDKLLQTSLDEKYGENYKTLTDRTHSKSKRYPIGSVAKITNNGTHYYFLAMSNVSAKGKPENVTMETITQALVGLWNYLSEDGHIEPIAIPVIGTGRGGLYDGNLKNVVQETIFSFISSAQESFIAKGLTICIYPPTLKKSNVSWEELCNYLKLNCCFAKENNKHKEYVTVSGKPTE